MSRSEVDFAKCVRAAQGMRRMRNIDIANHLGLPRQSITRLRSNRDCKINTALKLANFFGLSIEEMIELDK